MKVFLSYTTADQERVKEFYVDLKDNGFSPWMDCFDLLPGMPWDDEIHSRMADTDVCILFISSNSMQRIGYVTREVNYFTDKLKEVPKNYIFCIPVLLDDCNPSIELTNKIQYIKVKNKEDINWNKVISSLKLAASQRNIEVQNERSGVFSVDIKYDYELENGNPGYQFTYSYPFFYSKTLPNLVIEINEMLSSERIQGKLGCRIIPNEVIKDDDWLHTSYLESKSELSKLESIDYEVVQEIRFNNNYQSTICDVSYLNHSFMSFRFDTYYFNSGAAHGNSFTKCLNFQVSNEKIYSLSLLNFFTEDDWLDTQDEILDFIEEAIIKDIKRQKFFMDKNEYDENLDKWLVTGVKEARENCFSNKYSFNEAGWIFHFDPYDIDCFAAGKYEVLIPHEAFMDWYTDNFKNIFSQE